MQHPDLQALFSFLATQEQAGKLILPPSAIRFAIIGIGAEGEAMLKFIPEPTPALGPRALIAIVLPVPSRKSITPPPAVANFVGSSAVPNKRLINWAVILSVTIFIIV